MPSFRERGRIWSVATLYVAEFGTDLEAAREALDFRGAMALVGGLRVLSLFLTDDAELC